MLLPTCLVGSYPQPEWLIDRPRLSKQVPRLRMRDLWLIGDARLAGPEDAAPRRAPGGRERAGLHITPAGEQRRQSYSNPFPTPLAGIDIANPGPPLNRSGNPTPGPRIAGKIPRRHPVEVRDVELLR